MHELALCEAIADTATRRAAGRRVVGVTVRIGHLRQVVPDSLLFYWDFVTDATPLSGSSLTIEEVPAVVECGMCAERTTLTAPVPICGRCGLPDVSIVSGDEFLLVSLEIAKAG